MLPTLETPRLLLRPFVQDDLDDFFEYARSPLVGPMAGWPTHKTKQDTQMILDKFKVSQEVLALYHKQDGRVIGSIGLHPDPKRSVSDARMLGYALSEAYWGQGLMPEAARAMLAFAFDTQGCSLVSVYHFASNGQSRRVIEKLGFTREGLMRRACTLPDGSVADEGIYSMTKEEFEQIRAHTL